MRWGWEFQLLKFGTNLRGRSFDFPDEEIKSVKPLYLERIARIIEVQRQSYRATTVERSKRSVKPIFDEEKFSSEKKGKKSFSFPLSTIPIV